MTTIDTVEELEALYGLPKQASLVKETERITPQYRRLIEASPFVALATSGPEGLDCSPRGDTSGCVRIYDDQTLMMPDRRGNNRIDSLRNIVRDPRIGLLFLIPGSGTTLRVNGQARLSNDPELLQSFSVAEKEPRSVIIITIGSIYFQCARAVLRAGLWNPERHINPSDLPTPGQILAEMSDNAVGGSDYDAEWSSRAEKTLW